MVKSRLRYLVLAFTASVAFSQVPTFTVLNAGLDGTFGNAGKGLFDPQVAGFGGIAYGANLFVAVGNSTNEDVIRWATSTDAATWTPRSQAIGGNMKTFNNSKVHFLNGKFIFFAAHSLPNGAGAVTMVYTSTDGLNWTQSKVADGRPGFEEFDSGPTLTVVAGSNGAQMVSSDLVTWTARPVVPNGSGYDHNDVAYGAGRFVSTINGFGGQTYSSADATSWTALAGLTTPGGGRVEFGNGVFILNLGSDRYRSSDGVAFSKFTPTVPTGWLAPGGVPRFTGGRFVATAINLTTLRSGYLGSADGQSWTPVGFYNEAPTPAPGQSRLYFHSDIVFGNGKFVIAGIDQAQTLTTKTSLPLLMVIDASAIPVTPTAPTISAQPAATGAVLGRSASFSVTATGSDNTYQWRKDNVAIAGATTATYTIATVTAASAGNYSVVITNSVGSVTSSSAALTIVAASSAGRLVNMSIRTNAGIGDNTLIVGAALGGAGTSGNKAVLLRAVGPTLGGFGVSGALADPVMTVFLGSTQIAVNDDWDASAGAVFASVGAFAFANGSRDSAIYNSTIPAGSYSIQIVGKNNGTGIALAEIYDATPSASFGATTARLVNVSARTQVGTGDNILIAGFVIGGQTSARVLVRAVGPTLTAFSVAGALADPKLEIYNGATKTAENDNWDAATAATFASVGAFNFAPGSRDAALVATLAPGSYTAQVSGVGNTTGVALVEVYELP